MNFEQITQFNREKKILESEYPSEPQLAQSKLLRLLFLTTERRDRIGLRITRK